MKEYRFDIDPVAKPRQTRSDIWKDPPRPAVSKYRDFADTLRLLALKNGYSALDTLDVLFVIPFPKSYGKKKMEALNGRPHQVKPDVDNLVKAVLDIFLKNDSSVWKINAEKRWGYEGKIIITQ